MKKKNDIFLLFYLPFLFLSDSFKYSGIHVYDFLKILTACPLHTSETGVWLCVRVTSNTVVSS